MIFSHRSMMSVLMLLCAAVILSGCSVKIGGGDKKVSEVIEENLELRKQVKELDEQLELRISEAKALRQQINAGKEPIPGAEPPVLSRIKLGRYSGSISDDGAVGDTQVVAYVQTEDQFGRMLPVAGVGTMQVVLIPDDGEPRMIVEKRINAKEWRESYRSNFTGTHYTLRADLPSDMPMGTFDGTLRVTLRQADTGAVFSTQLPIKIMRQPEPESIKHEADDAEAVKDQENHAAINAEASETDVSDVAETTADVEDHAADGEKGIVADEK
ncbi:hypothetical protein [Poriferisphaera corsica]|nr:hypothetical protein [Poriferisphaera corsica]